MPLECLCACCAIGLPEARRATSAGVSLRVAFARPSQIARLTQSRKSSAWTIGARELGGLSAGSQHVGATLKPRRLALKPSERQFLMRCCGR